MWPIINCLGGFHYSVPFQSMCSYRTSFQASLTALYSKHSNPNYKGIIHQFWKNLTCARKGHTVQTEFLQFMDYLILLLWDNQPLFTCWKQWIPEELRKTDNNKLLCYITVSWFRSWICKLHMTPAKSDSGLELLLKVLWEWRQNK